MCEEGKVRAVRLLSAICREASGVCGEGGAKVVRCVYTHGIHVVIERELRELRQQERERQRDLCQNHKGKGKEGANRRPFDAKTSSRGAHVALTTLCVNCRVETLKED